MNLFGLSITRQKEFPLATDVSPLSTLDSSRGWWPVIRESFTGAWQQNIEVRASDVLSYPTAWACITLIASDIAKMSVRLMQQDNNEIWTEVDNAAFGPVLRKPNFFQTRVQFYENWMLSKLTNGNTYVLKARDNRNVVTGLYVLDPYRVRALVSPADGSVFYEIKRDYLSGQLQDLLIAPAREVIHDRWNTLYHPLIGLSPIYACGLAAYQGLKIQNNSAKLFANGSNPGGVLTAPGTISQATADRLKAYWDANYTGDNVGKVAVLGDGLKYDPMTLTAVDTELIKQLNWSDEKICSCFHVPPYMVGVGPMPSYNNVESLSQQYYSQCLQILIESLEILLDEGLAMLPNYGSEFDLDNLLRMDTATLIKSEKDAAGIKSPNESRKRLNLPPVVGGETVYRQQQDFSLLALSKRDAAQDPFARSVSVPMPVDDTVAGVASDEAPSKSAQVARFAARMQRRSIQTGLLKAAS